MKRNNAEGGANGATVTVANSNANSAGDALSTTSGTTRTYDTSWHHSGSTSFHCNEATGAAQVIFDWSTGVAGGGAFRGYFKMSALPASTCAIVQARDGSGVRCEVQIQANGKVRITQSGGTLIYSGTNVLSLETAYRFELIAFAGTTTSDGVISFAMYAGDSTTALETFSTAAANTSTLGITTMRWGKLTASPAWENWWDDIAFDDGATAFIGSTIQHISASATFVCAPAARAAGYFYAAASIHGGVNVPTEAILGFDAATAFDWPATFDQQLTVLDNVRSFTPAAAAAAATVIVSAAARTITAASAAAAITSGSSASLIALTFTSSEADAASSATATGTKRIDAAASASLAVFSSLSYDADIGYEEDADYSGDGAVAEIRLVPVLTGIHAAASASATALATSRASAASQANVTASASAVAHSRVSAAASLTAAASAAAVRAVAASAQCNVTSIASSASVALARAAGAASAQSILTAVAAQLAYASSTAAAATVTDVDAFAVLVVAPDVSIITSAGTASGFKYVRHTTLTFVSSMDAATITADARDYAVTVDMAAASIERELSL